MDPIIEKRLKLINTFENNQLRILLFRKSVRSCGEELFLGKDVFFLSGSNITIGKNVIVMDNVCFLDFDTINIGNNVIIGEGVTVYPGVTVGDNVILNPFTVVKKSIF
ncbi:MULTISPECIES: acyltransferase [Enterococcus]|uniref:acyltransferase n=1 Tax=Enterococcus TaxID=1350 RepID=UPI000789BCEC|nr:hypothetical protein [Enterococcus pernyi]UOO46426.1 hypothetical protein LLW22_04305 [Enterococcus casseliflavus]